MLSTDSDSPPVTKTTVSTDLLKTFNIITKLSINVLGKYLGVFSSLEILLPIQEPERNLELARVLDDGNQLLDLVRGKFTTSLVDINFSLLADEVSKSTTETLDFCKAKDDITLAFYVRIQDTQNMLKFRSLHQ